MNTINNESQNIDNSAKLPLSNETPANLSGQALEQSQKWAAQRMEVEVKDPEMRSRRDLELSEPIDQESPHEQAQEEERTWPPIQPRPMSDETKQEFLAYLESLDCRDVQTQAQKRLGLLLIGGYTEEQVEEECRPKLIPIDKIHKEIMEIQERALKQYERERRAEERRRQSYS